MSEDRPSKADRTRRDIVDAAVEVWALDNAASLGSVAERAGVGRTTLNRYFTDRNQLISAVDDECRRRYADAVARSRPTEGTGIDALMRMCTELIQLGAVLGIVFADDALVDPDSWFTEDDDPLGAVIGRGYADGSLDTDLPGDWIGTFVWTSLFAAHLVVRNGTRTWHEAAGLLTRTLTSGLASPS
ncbi:MAG TPA: TetR/AcrR family transcriptional regulator [Microlunatus sp.]|nr:TetR/AcrR family transcriptional regulator [Microlunatus sp.]